MMGHMGDEEEKSRAAQWILSLVTELRNPSPSSHMDREGQSPWGSAGERVKLHSINWLQRQVTNFPFHSFHFLQYFVLSSDGHSL